jgi:hypothetical protein
LPESDYTAGLEEVTTLMATTVPHQMAVDVVEKLLGVEVGAQGVKSSVQRRARRVIQWQDEEAGEIKAFEEKWDRSPPYITALAPDRSVEVAYLEVDGVQVLTREKTDTAPSETQKGRGGPGRTYVVSGREVKNAVLYEGAACAQESQRRGCILEKSCVSHLGEWLGLALLVWAVMLKRGFDRAQLLVVLSDGAEWIRRLCAARAEVIESLRFLTRGHRKAREQIESLQTYLRNNQDRMDYPRYRAMGLRVGSGAVESANYHVTGARLKLPGMRWSEVGAAQMARWRADLFNGVRQDRSRQILEAA